MKKVTTCLLTAIILFLVVISVSFMLSSYTGKDPLPNVFGYCPMIVISGSMEPTLMTNQLVLTKEASYEECEIGDIIVYKRGKDLIIHRLINKDDNLFITKGDANFDIDIPFHKEDVVGKYVAKIPLLGGMVSLLKTEIGTKSLFFIQIILISILIYGIHMRRKKQKHEKNLYRKGEKLYM